MIISINKQLTKILSKEQPMGLSTGIPELDESIHGYQKGKLITVAAVSGTGKTSFMCDGIITAANTVPVGVFSIEMGTRSIVDRMVYNIAGLNYHRCKKSRTKSEEQLVEDAKSKLASLRDIYFAEDIGCMYPKYILDKNKPVDSIELAVAEMVSDGVGIIFLDYIQQVRWGFKSESETLRLKEITGGLHELALQYDIPIVIMCQLTKEAANRATKKDQDPTPTISDIRDGGYIVNDSDVILLLYRPNMIKLTKEKIDLLGDVTEDSQIIIGKGRNGPNGAINVEFLNYCMSFRKRERKDDELF
jgi:replicative DNA helicase